VSEAKERPILMSAESVLLPLVEVEDIRHKAEVEAAERGEDIPAQFAAGDTAVLRAQVKRVVEWMETDPRVVVGHQALAALKAAGDAGARS